MGQPPPTAMQMRLAADVVREADANAGRAPVDLAAFWGEQERACAAPFSPQTPVMPFGIRMSGECVYDELGIAADYWRYDHDEPWRLELHRRYNEIAVATVGRPLLPEAVGDPERRWPAVRGLHDLFEARNEWHDWSWWLRPSASTRDELVALLDRVDKKKIREEILPPGWTEAKERLRALGIPPPRYRAQRGPITFACSIFGPENLIFLIQDDPPLAARFRDTILRCMLGIADVLDEEAGDAPEASPRGFYFLDDNCCLLTPAMYEFFGYPILKGVFDRFAPLPGHMRGQHSDSAMGHLLPILGELGLTTVNFGPTVPIPSIRRWLPRAVIHGQLAPFTFSNHDRVGMVTETLRDFEFSRADRGVVFTTAGSINNGSRLAGMRLMMSVIQRYCRYA